MARCEVCGNDYDKPLEIRLGGQSHEAGVVGARDRV
jgi:hypothetical protein